jgi:hypothetical protein
LKILDLVMRATNKTKTIPHVESVLRQQPSEPAIDATLEDGFPAGDPPSWTLGVERAAPDADFSSTKEPG